MVTVKLHFFSLKKIPHFAHSPRPAETDPYMLCICVYMNICIFIYVLYICVCAGACLGLIGVASRCQLAPAASMKALFT